MGKEEFIKKYNENKQELLKEIEGEMAYLVYCDLKHLSGEDLKLQIIRLKEILKNSSTTKG